MKQTIGFFVLLVAAFCVYGFIAAGEPGGLNPYFRIGYPIVGAVSLVVAGVLMYDGRRR